MASLQQEGYIPSMDVLCEGVIEPKITFSSLMGYERFKLSTVQTCK